MRPYRTPIERRLIGFIAHETSRPLTLDLRSSLSSGCSAAREYTGSQASQVSSLGCGSECHHNHFSGSGKSTLMKFLYGDEDNTRHLRVWADNSPLVRAHFYFWNPGQQMQKTLKGLLQTLLYHILQACSDLAPTLCPERWTAESRAQGSTSKQAWTLNELRRALTIFKAQCSAKTKFYFHIDGLDEYHGDCWEVIETLQDLSRAPNIKLCLSSRPWNEF